MEAIEEMDNDMEDVPEGSVRAFIEIGDDLHGLVISLDGVDSWTELSQVVHEACEEVQLPNLPEAGVMHIVLNVDGKPIPVTAQTQMDMLQRAKAIRVTLGSEGGSSSKGKTKKTRKGGYGSMGEESDE